MGKCALVEMVSNKELNTSYKLFGNLPPRFINFYKNNSNEINVISFNKELNQEEIKKEYIQAIESRYHLKNIEKTLSESKKDLENYKWYNWHLPFFQKYWKESNKAFFTKVTLDTIFIVSNILAGFSPENSAGYIFLSLAMKGSSESLRRGEKKEDETKIKELNQCKNYFEKLKNIFEENININKIVSKEAREMMNQIRMFDINYFSREELFSPEKINEKLEKIYRRELKF